MTDTVTICGEQYKIGATYGQRVKRDTHRRLLVAIEYGVVKFDIADKLSNVTSSKEDWHAWADPASERVE